MDESQKCNLKQEGKGRKERKQYDHIARGPQCRKAKKILFRDWYVGREKSREARMVTTKLNLVKISGRKGRHAVREVPVARGSLMCSSKSGAGYMGVWLTSVILYLSNVLCVQICQKYI